LRHCEEALGEGVACREKQPKHGQLNDEAVQGQYEQERAKAQSRRQQQCFLRAHRADSQRPVFCALDMGIKVAVGIIIDNATGGAHQHRAQHEYHQDMWAWHSFGSQPQAPKRWPQQQQYANRLIQPHQLLVMNEALRECHDESSRMEGRNTSVTSIDCPCRVKRERRAQRPDGLTCNLLQARL
jgi:hypothetical protein